MLEGARERVEKIISGESACLCDAHRQKWGQTYTYSDIYSLHLHVNKQVSYPPERKVWRLTADLMRQYLVISFPHLNYSTVHETSVNNLWQIDCPQNSQITHNYHNITNFSSATLMWSNYPVLRLSLLQHTLIWKPQDDRSNIQKYFSDGERW